MNALRAAFPEGEPFFIEAAREGLARLEAAGSAGRRSARGTGLDDQLLEEDYRLFVAQERTHAKQHAKWNTALIHGRGGSRASPRALPPSVAPRAPAIRGWGFAALKAIHGRGGLVSMLWPRVRAYLRPSFHPWQTDERATFEQVFGGLRSSLGIAPFAR